MNLCLKDEIEDCNDQAQLIGFLHDLGIALYFPNNPRLADYGILNPEWVTKAFYKIINDRTLILDRQGILPYTDLKRILDAKHYPQKRHRFLLDLMYQFELAFQIEDGTDTKHLIPSVLPKEEPLTGEWSNSLDFQFRYSVLAPSILARFIVRMNQYVHQATTWRNGTVLVSDRNTALVKGDRVANTITIKVTGNPNTRRDFLSQIRMQLKSIHQNFSGLKVTPLVPIPDHPKVPPVEYEHLLTLEELNQETFIPPGLKQTVNVRELLNGVDPPRHQQFDVFLSHNSSDKPTVRQLAEELTRRGLTVWLDEDELRPGLPESDQSFV